MSATGAETPRTRGRLLTWLGWLACVAATFVLAAGAANRHGGDSGFQAGYMTGRVVAAFVVAFAIGLAIQWGVRKRRTVPLWIGLIAVVISLLELLAAAGNEAAAAAACTPPAKSYGAAPAGWTYTPAPRATRSRVIRLMKLTQAGGTDVTLARGGGRAVTLVAIADTDSSFVDGFVRAARADHATVTRGPHGASAIELPGNAARVVLGPRGCNVVIADGRGDAAVDTVARAVFR
jgi:hypothetical protein